MNKLAYHVLRNLAMRSSWALARRLYALAFRFLDRHNRALDQRDVRLAKRLERLRSSRRR